MYVRFTVIDKTTLKAIGTIELFDNAGEGQSFLHIDFSAPYETREYISELLTLAEKDFARFFGFKNLSVRALPDAKERIMALGDAGYQPCVSEEDDLCFMKKVSI